MSVVLLANLSFGFGKPSMFRRRGVVGGGGGAKVQHLNASVVPSLGNLTTNFAPCSGHLNLTVQGAGSI